METGPKLNAAEKEQLLALADSLDEIQKEKTGGKGDVLMEKLIRYLRSGDADSAKVLLSNEADKFIGYRGDAVPLIIKELYDGNGSPWVMTERRMKASK